MPDKLKLALQIIISPASAFTEIEQKRLLSDAFWIMGIAGFFAMLSAIGRAAALGNFQLFVIGRDNPLVWIGLFMLYALAVLGMLKWVGKETDYPTVLMIMGWSGVYLLLHQMLGAIYGVLLVTQSANSTTMQFFDAVGMAFPLLYVITMAIGLQTICKISFFKGLIAYLAVWAAMLVAIDHFYTQLLMKPFENTLQGVSIAVLRIAPTPLWVTPVDPWLRSAGQMPRLIAGCVGLVVGFVTLGKANGWSPELRRRTVIVSAVTGVICLGVYLYAWNSNSFYSDLLSVQRLYQDKQYEQTAVKLSKIIPLIGDNQVLVWGLPNKALLTTDVADLYYQANMPVQTIAYYNKFLAIVNTAGLPGNIWEHRITAYGRLADAGYLANDLQSASDYYSKMKQAISKAKLGDAEDMTNAQLANGVGMVYDMQGKHREAISQFAKAAEDWPDFREPWIRMSVTYNRMGKYDKAIESGNHALKTLDSEAVVAWVALAEAFANTGDTTQAKAAIAMVSGLNSDLAAKIGPKLSDWKNATSKLTVQDLKFPLEAQPVKPPKSAK